MLILMLWKIGISLAVMSDAFNCGDFFTSYTWIYVVLLIHHSRSHSQADVSRRIGAEIRYHVI